jgi:hypothetical protein
MHEDEMQQERPNKNDKQDPPIVVWSDLEKEMKRKLLEQAVKMYLHEKSKLAESNKTLPNKAINNIITKLGSPSWLTRFKVYYAVKKYLHHKDHIPSENNSPRNYYNENDVVNDIDHAGIPSQIILPFLDNNQTRNPSDMSTSSIRSSISSLSSRKKGGRPRQETAEQHALIKTKLDTAIDFASMEYYHIRKKARINGNRVPFNTISNAITNALLKVDLPLDFSGQISRRTIKSRGIRGNPHGRKNSFSNVTPMVEMEPLLVDLCIQLNRMNESVDKETFLNLANDLIKGTPTEMRVIDFKKRICGYNPTILNENDNAKLGRKYFNNFMLRHKDKIYSTKVCKKDLKRLEWGNYFNVEKMYMLIYDELCQAGVAIRQPTLQYYNIKGDLLPSADGSFGLPTDVDLICPDYLLFVDECGSNTDMQKDKQQGKQRVIAEKGFRGTKEAITTDLHYTVMGFTAATGEAVLCVVIFKSENEHTIPHQWVSGIDITKLKDTVELENLNDGEEFLRSNKGKGTCLPYGPECTFHGKSVPCLVQWSPHGGVNAQILVNCLQHMDKLELFPRSDKLKPFVLLDGHSSRFDLQLVQYIRDQNHPWSVCLGLPYGTHLWQVGDSPQQNGNFKLYQSRAKEILLKEKYKQRLPKVFHPTDIIPIINYAWDRSFACTEGNKTAITTRGWNPCNYALLVSKEILRTKVDSVDTDNDDTATNHTQNTCTVTINIGEGTSAAIFDTICDENIKKRAKARVEDRERESMMVRKTLDRTKKLTSGPAFKKGHVGLHHDVFHDHLVDYHNGKLMALDEKKKKSKKSMQKRKEIINKIREKPEEKWSITDLNRLLTYKKYKEDPALKTASNDRTILLSWWHDRKNRPSPHCSPLTSDDELDDVHDNRD